MTVEQAIKEAVDHHQAGRLQDAEQLYRAILQAQPQHPDANHNLGVLAVQVGKPEIGLPHFKIALEANPVQEQYWLSYIDALIRTDQPVVARKVLEQGRQHGIKGHHFDGLAILLNNKTHNNPSWFAEMTAGTFSKQTMSQSILQLCPPHSLITSFHMGNTLSSKDKTSASNTDIEMLATLFKQGRYYEAKPLAQSMTERFPQNGVGWKALGLALKQMGQCHDALAPMKKAEILIPDDAEVHNNLGVILHDLGQLSEAEASYRRSLAINANYATAHCHLGTTLYGLGRLEEAEASYRRALTSKSDYAEAYNNLGSTLRGLGRLKEAEESYRSALTHKPDYYEAYNNLGITLDDMGLLNDAAVSYRSALQINPNYADAYSNLGDTLTYLDDLSGAANAYQPLVSRFDTNVGLAAIVSLAIINYLAGNYLESQRLLNSSQQINNNNESRLRHSIVYWNYLQKLLAYPIQDDSGDRYIESCHTLYVIGESHALSAHGVTVHYRNTKMQCL